MSNISTLNKLFSVFLLIITFTLTSADLHPKKLPQQTALSIASTSKPRLLPPRPPIKFQLQPKKKSILPIPSLFEEDQPAQLTSSSSSPQANKPTYTTPPSTPPYIFHSRQMRSFNEPPLATLDPHSHAFDNPLFQSNSRRRKIDIKEEVVYYIGANANTEHVCYEDCKNSSHKAFEELIALLDSHRKASRTTKLQ